MVLVLEVFHFQLRDPFLSQKFLILITNAIIGVRSQRAYCRVYGLSLRQNMSLIMSVSMSVIMAMRMSVSVAVSMSVSVTMVKESMRVKHDLVNK